MEKKETLPNSGEQIPLSSGEEEPVTSPSAEGRTYHFDKNVEMTFPFHENQEGPVPSTRTMVKPVPLSSSGQPSSSRQRVKCPVESSEFSDPDTSESCRTVSLVEPVPSTSSGQQSRGHQPMFLFGENSDASDTETAESSSSDDGIPFVRFGSRRRSVPIPVQIERVPRNFNVMEIRYRMDSIVTSAENALRNYVKDVHYFRELSTGLEALVAQSLTVHIHPSAELELLRRKYMKYYLQIYYNIVNKWGGYYSLLIDKAEVQKNLLETFRNRLVAMMEGPFNFFEADEIYNVIDDLQTRLKTTNYLSSTILFWGQFVSAIVKRIAVGQRIRVRAIELDQQD